MKWHFLSTQEFTVRTPIAIMFAGGHGCVDWDDINKVPRWGDKNFLMRNISKFLNNRIAVIVVDMQPTKILIDERATCGHAKSIENLLQEIAAHFPENKTVLLLNSASAASISHVCSTQGSPVVFVSPVFVAPIARFNVDLLIVHNKYDTCEVCHADNFPEFIKTIRAKFQNVRVTRLNGRLQEDHACSARSPHGLWGSDPIALFYIFNFIKEHT